MPHAVAMAQPHQAKQAKQLCRSVPAGHRRVPAVAARVLWGSAASRARHPFACGCSPARPLSAEQACSTLFEQSHHLPYSFQPTTSLSTSLTTTSFLTTSITTTTQPTTAVHILLLKAIVPCRRAPPSAAPPHNTAPAALHAPCCSLVPWSPLHAILTQTQPPA